MVNVQQRINLGDGGVWPLIAAAFLLFDTQLSLLITNTNTIISVLEISREIQSNTFVTLSDIRKDLYEMMKELEAQTGELGGIDAEIFLTNSRLADIKLQMLETGAIIEVINEGLIGVFETAVKNAVSNQETSYAMQINNANWEIQEAATELIQQTLDAILVKIPAEPLLARLNMAVTSIEYANRDAVQWDGDFCENDPFGFGPINCEGIEEEAGTINGIVFV